MRLPKRRLKDVKKAEVIEHDQPIKALQNKTFTDNVAMNIALKDSARDKLMPPPQALHARRASVPRRRKHQYHANWQEETDNV